MYREHVPVIAAAMRHDTATFKRGCLFVLLSIRQPFIAVREQLKEVGRDRHEAKCLFGWKLDGYIYLRDQGSELYARVLAHGADTEAALWDVTRIPGIGVVKGAFILQLLGHDVACIDTRNIQRDGRSPRQYRSDGDACKNAPAFRRKIAAYVSDTGGMAEHYWNAWCTNVAEIYGETPNQISARHLDFVRPRLRKLNPALLYPSPTEIPL